MSRVDIRLEPTSYDWSKVMWLRCFTMICPKGPISMMFWNCSYMSLRVNCPAGQRSQVSAHTHNALQVLRGDEPRLFYIFTVPEARTFTTWLPQCRGSHVPDGDVMWPFLTVFQFVNQLLVVVQFQLVHSVNQPLDVAHSWQGEENLLRFPWQC